MNYYQFRRIIVLYVLAAGIFQVNVSEAGTDDTLAQRSPETSWSDIFENSKKKVVQIFSYGTEYDWHQPFKRGNERSLCGSGYIAHDGDDIYIYTNFHVIAECDTFYLQHPDVWKERFELEYIGGSPDCDCARLRIKPEELERLSEMLPYGKLESFSLGDSDTVVQGQEIMLIGYPQGGEYVKHSVGTISGQQFTNRGECFTTTAPSYGGNSGGPCIDKSGNIIGILFGGYADTESIGYIIPINKLKNIREELIGGAVLPKTFWGLHIARTTSSTLKYLGLSAQAGSYVTHVNVGTLAHKAGIMQGDVVSKINGFKVDRFCHAAVPWSTYKVHYSDVLDRIKSGDSATFGIYRNGQELECSVIKTSESPLAIKRYRVPFEEAPVYDVFAGMVICQLAYNHCDMVIPVAQALLEQGIYFDAMKYLKSDNSYEPRLIVTYLFPETEIAKSEAIKITDCIIKSVNGRLVGTIEEFHEAVKVDAYTGYVVIEMSGGTKIACPLVDVLKQEPSLSKKYGYSLSPLFEKLRGKI